MTRVKRGVTRHARHKDVIERAEGSHGTRNHLYKSAHEVVMRADAYRYRDRRTRKRDMRRLWITRINAAARQHGLTYATFMHGLREAGIEIDRKVLADVAVRDTAVFASLIKEVSGPAGKE